jgi:hypothetical protein
MIDDSCLADLLSFLDFDIGAERAIKEEVWDITCVSPDVINIFPQRSIIFMPRVGPYVAPVF